MVFTVLQVGHAVREAAGGGKNIELQRINEHLICGVRVTLDLDGSGVVLHPTSAPLFLPSNKDTPNSSV
jgi:hypothetical protein